MDDGRDEAVLAGGCFWCLQPVFEALEGVEAVVVGYTGGHVPDPTYEEVCTDRTGHAEAVRIAYDPAVIGYDDLLRVFFTVHDPTTPNRQGADVGTQYRSAIFYRDADQKAAAEGVLDEVAREGLWTDPLVTELTPLDVFYPAEDYHQGYYAKHPEAGYCRAVIAPKLAKFRKAWRDRLRTEARKGT